LLLPAAAPVAGVLVTAPSPEQKIVRMSPVVAGRETTPGMTPTGATRVVVLAIWIAPCVAELAVSMVKIPGAAAESLTVMEGLVPPGVVTVNVAVGEESNSHGTWKLI
jgi:hypothetical protein